MWKRYGDTKQPLSEPDQVWQGPTLWLASIPCSHSTLGVSCHPAQHRSQALLTAVVAKLGRDRKRKPSTHPQTKNLKLNLKELYLRSIQLHLFGFAPFQPELSPCDVSFAHLTQERWMFQWASQMYSISTKPGLAGNLILQLSL